MQQKATVNVNMTNMSLPGLFLDIPKKVTYRMLMLT